MDDDQWFAQRPHDPVGGRSAQPPAIAPAQRTGADPAAGGAHLLAEAQHVERGQRVGPDADTGTDGGIGAPLDHGHVMAHPAQGHRGGQSGDTGTDDHDALGHVADHIGRHVNQTRQ